LLGSNVVLELNTTEVDQGLYTAPLVTSDLSCVQGGTPSLTVLYKGASCRILRDTELASRGGNLYVTMTVGLCDVLSSQHLSAAPLAVVVLSLPVLI
jgi:hypothetical protein